MRRSRLTVIVYCAESVAVASAAAARPASGRIEILPRMTRSSAYENPGVEWPQCMSPGSDCQETHAVVTRRICARARRKSTKVFVRWLTYVVYTRHASLAIMLHWRHRRG